MLGGLCPPNPLGFSAWMSKAAQPEKGRRGSMAPPCSFGPHPALELLPSIALSSGWEGETYVTFLQHSRARTEGI